MDTSNTMHYPNSLEMTILSAENLYIPKKQRKNNLIVLIRSGWSGNEECTTKMPTENGALITWNETVEMKLPENADFVFMEVHCRSTTSGKGKLVGATRVPVTDFLGGFAPTNHLQFLSYRLRDSDGDRNGVINISVRLKGLPRHRRCSITEVGVPMSGSQRFGAVVTGVPAAWHTHNPQTWTK